MIKKSIILLLMVMILSNCTKSTISEIVAQNQTSIARVVYIDLEGGFWGLITESGEELFPLNLGDEFKVDQLLVKVTYQIDLDTYSIAMWGKTIIISEINTLNGS